IARVPTDQLAAIKGNHTELQRVLGYHTVLEDVDRFNNVSKGLRWLSDKVINSSNELPIRLNAYTSIHTVTAQGVNITERAIRVSNGYVHALDGIMVPPQGDVMEIVAANGGLTSFVSLLKSTGVVDVIDSVLRLHIGAGKTKYSTGMHHGQTMGTLTHAKLMIFMDLVTGDTRVNTANIVQKDISATNGVIHIIDEVLIPPGVLLKIQDNGLTIG
ncbi:hypothetical protein EGW08_008646, partial [Elysia chlorotica]